MLQRGHTAHNIFLQVIQLTLRNRLFVKRTLQYYFFLQLQEDRDPRQRQRPSRLKDVLKLYFCNYETMLPTICPLDFLASIIVDFCRENVVHVRPITQSDQEQYNNALKNLVDQAEVRLFKVSTSFRILTLFQAFCR